MSMSQELSVIPPQTPGNDALLRHMERLVAAGDWDCLKPYLRAAKRSGIPALVMEARHAAGYCVMCERAPCCDCGKKNPLFCDVCWQIIKDNCPPGMVVSGLAQITQMLTGGKI